MAQLTKQALIVENNQSFPNNNAGAITPTVLRNFNTDIIDSTVNQSVYTADSGSWNEKIDALSTGSALITASVDFATITFTKGDGSQFDLVVTASVASVDWDNISDKPSGLVSSSEQVVDILYSVNEFTSSQESKDSTLASYTGSVNQKFSTIGTQSGSWDNTSLNQFTASQESKDVTLAFYTSSVDAKFSTIGSQSGSWDNTALNSFTASQETKNTTLGSVTSSLQGQLTTIGSQSGSWVTESETGSFARVDVSNTFTATQQFGDVNVTGTANIHILNVTYESSSVIYSSGSNVLGDELTDTQTLSGSVKVVGGLTVNGINVLTESVDLGPLNSFTASQEGINTALNASTASQQVSIDALNSFTSSQEVLNLQFATTGSNTFEGNQTINGSVNLIPASVSINSNYIVPFISGSTISKDSVDTLFYNPLQNSLFVSASTGRSSLTTVGYAFSSGSGATAYQARLTKSEISQTAGAGYTIGISGNPSSTGYPGLTTSTNPGVFATSGSGESYIAIELQASQSFTDGRVTIKRPLVVESDLTASLQEGYVWVGGAGNVTNTVATSSFSGGTTDLGPLNSFTASQELLNTQLLNASTSFEEKFTYIGTQSGSWSGGGADLGPLNTFTSSQEVLNAQFADTGSNTFNGNQIVNGVVTQNVTAPADDTQSDFVSVTGATINGVPYNYVNQGLVNYPGFGAAYSDSFITEYYDSLSYNFGAEFIVNGGRVGATLNASGSSSPASFRIQDQYDGTTFGNFYADDMQIGEYAIGTATRIGIGHIALPLLELKANDIIITGSVTISGSMNSSVIPLTITSNTASLNASSGSTFQLNLVSGSATRLEVSGTTSGQTINLLVSQSATGPGTLVFGSGIEQPSGSFYSASQVASGEDIITMATFINPGRLYLANIKNFI